MMSAVSHHSKYRTKLCRNFTNGNCPFGQKCSFLHPVSGINPLSSSLAQYLLSWNILLPQLLARSGQQANSKMVPPQSPPRPQGPRLVGEDPSPSTSLLLSASDCASPDQMLPTKQTRRRKKYPCRQFVRTGGWCPAGAKCKLYHDVTALPSVDGQNAEHAFPFETDMHSDGGRTISGGVLMSVQTPSPPVIGQEYSGPPRYTEAAPSQPYQAVYWPNYAWQPYYYAPLPAMAAVPVPATTAPSLAVQHDTLLPPSQEMQTDLPLGAYEVNGTTYFPPQMASVPAPAPGTCSVPAILAPYGHTMAPSYPYYAPPPPVGYYDVSAQTMDVRPQTSFNPFSSDPIVPSELPVIPRSEDRETSPLQRDGLPHIFPLAGVPGPTNTVDQFRVVREQEFPYQPPKNQQVGHARRISINVKKHDRTNSV